MTRSPIVRARNLARRLRALPGVVMDIQTLTSELRGAQSELAERADHAQAVRHDALLDAANYAVRRQPLTRERTRVLFLVHHIEAWDSLDSVVRKLREAPDFEVIVASIPRHFRGSDGFGDEDLVHEGLIERGVPHLRMTQTTDADRLAVVRALTPDVIFRQSQWDADVPRAYSTRNLSFARLCLVPYETMGIVENLPLEGVDNSAVDNFYHRTAWRVFCANPIVKEIAGRDGALGGEQFVVTGHPKADRLRSAEPAWPISHDGAAPRARIVWSAHHTITDEWTGFGLAHLVACDMLEWARSTPDVDFVFMPHPALRPYINYPASPITPAQADDFVAQWNDLPNATTYAKGDYAPVLAASDVMLVDGLSMLVEYQFQGKPLIFLERPGHRPFNDIGKVVISGAHAVPNITAARTLVDDFLAGTPDPLAEQQRANMKELFGEGSAADRIVAELRTAVAQERACCREGLP